MRPVAGAVRTELVDGHDLEAVPLAELAHGLDGPRVAPAEQRILAEHHALHTQTLDQEDAHEVLGRVLREVDSELQVQDAVHPGQQEQTVTVLVAGEQGVRTGSPITCRGCGQKVSATGASERVSA